MFGIKTKKDRRIEELEKLLGASNFKRPSIITTQQNVVCLRAKQIIGDYMTIECAKELIAQNMVEKVKEQITYEIEDVGSGKGERVLTGYLTVVYKN